ncbi:MAG: hypothetical protein MJ162_06005 [Treponema sp.]|nr:hypothetical protein [Treponema sp.]
MEIQTENGIKEALKFIEAGDPVKAQQITTSLFETELECPELSYTNRCSFFWIETAKRLQELTDPYEAGIQLLAEWKNFQIFLSRDSFVYEPACTSFRIGFFKTALKHYQKLIQDSEAGGQNHLKDPRRKTEILRNAGICWKKLGNFEDAKNCLSEANRISPNMAPVLAELADCYALCGEERFAKVLFREAFFINADSIDIDFLDSELIKCLISKTIEKGYNGKVLKYWIPVFGVLGGIFNIRRELSSQEVCRLRQNIYAMESESKDPSCKNEVLTPQLLNSYFWLVDHYVLTHENPTKINEVLLKIKVLDPAVHQQYIK